ncbi:hypothetical protein [Streptococcus caprae]
MSKLQATLALSTQNLEEIEFEVWNQLKLILVRVEDVTPQWTG